MEVSVKVGVSPEKFYKTFLSEVAKDVSYTTGKKVRASHLMKGYNYTKLYKTGDAKIKIYGLVENKEYHSQYSYAEMVVTMSYYISDEDGDTIVTYVETAEGKKKKTVSQGLASLGAKSKSKKMIKRIAAFALEENEDEEENVEEEE